MSMMCISASVVGAPGSFICCAMDVAAASRSAAAAISMSLWARSPRVSTV